MLPSFVHRIRFQDPSDGTPITPGRRVSGDSFEVVFNARSAAGRVAARLEVEAKAHGTPFDGSDLVVGPWVDVDGNPQDVSLELNGLPLETTYHVRARLVVDAAHDFANRTGPWFHAGRHADPDSAHLPPGCAADLDVDGLCDSTDPDADGDGDPGTSDCDESDPAIYTGAPELCDAVDSDRDGSAVDEFLDTDGDLAPNCIDVDDDDDFDPDDTDLTPTATV